MIPRDLKTPSFDKATKLVAYKDDTYIVPEWVQYLTRDDHDHLVCGWDNMPIKSLTGRWMLFDSDGRWTYAIKKMDTTTSFIHEIEG